MRGGVCRRAQLRATGPTAGGAIGHQRPRHRFKPCPYLRQLHFLACVQGPLLQATRVMSRSRRANGPARESSPRSARLHRGGPPGRGHLARTHPVDQHAGGSMGFWSRHKAEPATPSRMNGNSEHQAGLRNRCVWCPLVFVNKTTLCNKFATIFLLDCPLYIMLSFIGLG